MAWGGQRLLPSVKHPKESSMNGLLRKLRTLAIAAPLAATLALPIAGIAHADERDFTLVNNSSASLTRLYVSPSAADTWGDDILGRGVMGPGESVLVYFTNFSDGSCGYDIQASFQDGGEGKLIGVDLCATDTVTFSDS
jgi:hypothetical protein